MSKYNIPNVLQELRNIGDSQHRVGLDTPIKPPAPKIYTVSRCRNDDTLYGPIHWSADGETTFCGSDMRNKSWFILTNDFSGNANCKRCIRASNALVKGAQDDTERRAEP